MQMTPRARRFLVLLSAICIFGCAVAVDRHPIFDGAVCGPYPSTIGQYLKVGTSADEVLERIGPPNERRQEKDQIYYVFRIQPFPGRRLAGGMCYSKPTDDSASYEVAFGPDKKISSVVYSQLNDIDPDHLQLPELVAEHGDVVLAMSICRWNGKLDDRECPGYADEYSLGRR
jgi:outer membrane protein assembly factor BamE (lipoprotein component of BamABCDE complex)